MRRATPPPRPPPWPQPRRRRRPPQNRRPWGAGARAPGKRGGSHTRPARRGRTRPNVPGPG
eukprot:8226288-Lingulodinium_polyedra.AAC.1